MSTKFRIDSQTLTGFLTLIKTDEYPVNITQAGWEVDYPDRGSFMFMSGKLKKESFVEYPSITKTETIVITNGGFLMNYLSRFSGTVELTVMDKEILIASESKTGFYRLGVLDQSEQNDMNEKTKLTPNISFEKIFKVPVSIFTSSTKDASLLKKERFRLSIEGNVFQVAVGDNDFKLVEKKKLDGEFNNVTSTYGALLKEIFSSLEGEVEIGLKTYYPLRVSQTTKTGKITYILAPIDEKSEVEEKTEENKTEKKEE